MSSPYVAEASRLQQTMLRTFGRPAPIEFDSVFDAQRMLHPLCAIETTWKEPEEKRLLINDVGAFLMEVLDALWTQCGFRVVYTSQTIPTDHQQYLWCGLRAHTAIQVSLIPGEIESRAGSSAYRKRLKGIEKTKELRYSQFVVLDLFRLLYEAPNPLPVLADYHMPISGGNCDILSSYLYGVLLMNHPWCLSETAHVPLAQTQFPWEMTADALAISHLRYHFPGAFGVEPTIATDAVEVLKDLFRACVFPPFGYQRDKCGSVVLHNATRLYLNATTPARHVLLSAFDALTCSPNPRLRTVGQVALFLLGSDADRERLRDRLRTGEWVLVHNFDFLVTRLAPILLKHKVPVPKPESLDLF